MVDNFRRLAGQPEIPRKGPLYTDSDVYKWMEAAAWALASNETSDADKQKLRSDIDALIWLYCRRAGAQRLPEHLLRRR